MVAAVAVSAVLKSLVIWAFRVSRGRPWGTIGKMVILDFYLWDLIAVSYIVLLRCFPIGRHVPQWLWGGLIIPCVAHVFIVMAPNVILLKEKDDSARAFILRAPARHLTLAAIVSVMYALAVLLADRACLFFFFGQ